VIAQSPKSKNQEQYHPEVFFLLRVTFRNFQYLSSFNIFPSLSHNDNSSSLPFSQMNMPGIWSSRLIAACSVPITAVLKSISSAEQPKDNHASSRSSKVSSTAWLDGMRGYASFFVSLYHLRNGFTDNVHKGWGLNGQNHSLLELPFIRLLFSGPAMVVVFFLVSGYSLSWGSFRDLQVGNVERCLDRIRSSVFRRFLRLYLPLIASSFVVLICICLGLYDKSIKEDARTGYREPMPKIFPNAVDQILDWVRNTLSFINIWAGGENRHLYYPHSWSIPVEFKCSILLYVVLVGIAKFRILPRVVILCLCMIYCVWTDFYHMWTFFLGATLAQLNTYRVVEHGWVGGFPPEMSRRKTILRIGVFIVGVYLLSFPDWQGIRYSIFKKLA
jgi:peptidoglycan/LPS O-acetylase OafA/YrhL